MPTGPLQEFLDLNLHRAFPLQDGSVGIDLTGVFTLPTRFISDLFICAPAEDGIDPSLFYLSKFTVRSRYVDIEVSYEGQAAPVGAFTRIDMQADMHTTYLLQTSGETFSGAVAGLGVVTGQLTVGDAEALRTSIGTYLFAASATRILATRVSRGLVGVPYMKIDNTYIRGAVNFRSGSGVTFKVSGNIITIERDSSADNPQSIQSDDDVANALISKLGTPILSINGFRPDGDGALQIETGDCIAASGGRGFLRLSNPCSKPCCSSSELAIAATSEAISRVDSRQARLESSMAGVTTLLRTLDAALTKLEG